MKAQILKMSGCKTQKEFYKKYPSEEAFMKVHGKEFKKAQMGAAVTGGSLGFKPINFTNEYNKVDKLITGTTNKERQAMFEKQQAAASLQEMANKSSEGNLMESFMGDEEDEDIPEAQFGGNYSLGQAPSSGLNMQQGFPQAQNSFSMPTPKFNAYNPQGDQAGTAMAKGIFQGANPVGASPFEGENAWSKIGKGLGKYAGPIGSIIGGIGALKQEKEAAKAAKQTKLVSDVSLQAAQSTDVDARRQMQDTFSKQRNAMMQPTTGEELFPVNGVGTNVLARNGRMLQDGGYVGGNPSEIQNTYDPYDIYTDSGYEPLNDSNIKQYYHGGRVHQMQDGGGMPWGMISQKATGLGQSLMGGQNAGGQLGNTVGTSLGNAIAPGIGGAVGGFVGGMAGNLLDPYAKRIKKDNAATQKNMMGMASVNMAKGIQSQNQSFMEDGGWVSNDWQPQTIASFGGLDEQEVYDYAHEGMNSLRAGGHLRDYTPPSDRAMETYRDGGDVKSYGLGGELQTHWGGGAETISRNPYLPGTGETVMFRGKSHEEYSPNGETGIGVTYGGNPVEVERGEPMVELEEGGVVDPQTGEVQKSGVVFGNLKIPNQYIDMLGDKSAKGKKFKNYVADLSKTEAKQNKLIEKSINELNGFTPLTSFDKLKMTALQANIQGANMKLKDIADKKINAASLQNAINDTAEERGLVADDLARGKVKIDKEAQKEYAKFGGKFTKAQEGISKYGLLPWQGNKTGLGKKTASEFSTTDWDQIADKLGFKGKGNKEFEEFLLNNPEAKKIIEARHQNLYGKSAYMDPEHLGAGWAAPELKTLNLITAPEQQEGVQTGVDWTSKNSTPQVEEKETNQINPYILALNSLIPLIRPSDAEDLDASQLYPEMYAMATNQLEPVQANFYRPELGVPYDISLQDQLNANQADYRAAQRTMGYNPAAQANLNAQKYQANQQVLGDQFRANQAMKDKVYGENRNILNDAKLKNLGIADQQYTRQSEALSNTKATTQAALNSIADKYAKNKLENRTLGVMENMYNYRFNKKGRAINMNPLQLFNISGNESGNKEETAPEGYEYETILKKKKKTDAKNGSIVKSYKNL
jgi:hypothetical protein